MDATRDVAVIHAPAVTEDGNEGNSDDDLTELNLIRGQKQRKRRDVKVRQY